MMNTFSCSLASVLLGLVSCTGPGIPDPIPQPGAPVPVSAYEWSQVPQEPSSQSTAPRTLPGDTSVPFGAGVTMDPEMGMVTFGWDNHLNRLMAMGPELTFGGDTDRFLFSAAIQMKTFLNTASPNEEPSRWQPYIQAGLGWTWFQTERPLESDENSFLANGGLGLRYRLSQDYSIGTAGLANFTATEILGDRWYYSWQVLQLVIHF